MLSNFQLTIITTFVGLLTLLFAIYVKLQDNKRSKLEQSNTIRTFLRNISEKRLVATLSYNKFLENNTYETYMASYLKVEEYSNELDAFVQYIFYNKLIKHNVFKERDIANVIEDNLIKVCQFSNVINKYRTEHEVTEKIKVENVTNAFELYRILYGFEKYLEVKRNNITDYFYE